MRTLGRFSLCAKRGIWLFFCLILFAGTWAHAEPSKKTRPPGRLTPVIAENKWGYMDPEGNMAIPASFDHTADFSEGLAPVRLGKKWGYIDRKGRFVIQPQFDWAWAFSGGRALVGRDGKLSYVDKKGRSLA